MDEEGEVAGEVEAPSQPPARWHEKQRSAVRCVPAQMIDGCLEGLRVGRLPVSDATEVRQRRAVLPTRAAHSAVLHFHRVPVRR